ncbi:MULTISPECIES: hypothetical protein [unclassified Streptomyces]|uniref:Uncharacterized protein n=1 Tax=Streptomyces sp. R33 TaxID=3238629 RepID=A0AB39XVQ9_9ACTN|nr:hypothetical protein [Streptomyces sp. XY332]
MKASEIAYKPVLLEDRLATYRREAWDQGLSALDTGDGAEEAAPAATGGRAAG